MLKSILKKFKDKEITIKEFNNFLESSGNFDDLNNIQQIIFSKVLYNIFSYYAKDIDTKNIIYIMAVTRRVITNFKDDELNQNELVNSIVNTLINVFDSFSNKKKYIFKMKYFFFLKRGKTKVHDFDFEAETMFFLSEIIYIELLYKNFPLKYYIYTSCNNVRDEKRKEILQQIFTEKNYILPLEKFCYSFFIVERALSKVSLRKNRISNKIEKIYDFLNNNIERLKDDFEEIVYFYLQRNEQNLIDELIEILK